MTPTPIARLAARRHRQRTSCVGCGSPLPAEPTLDPIEGMRCCTTLCATDYAESRAC